MTSFNEAFFSFMENPNIYLYDKGTNGKRTWIYIVLVVQVY